MTTISRSKKLVYHHIPKNAGTYIESVLTDYDDFVSYSFTILAYKDPLFFARTDMGIREKFHKQLHIYSLTKEELSNYIEFTFVRNPYTRLISGFQYNMGKKFEEINPKVDYEKTLDLSYVIENREKLTTNSYLHLFRTQYLEVKNCPNLKFIGRYETMYDDLDKLFKLVDLPLDYPKEVVNKSPDKKSSYKNYYTKEILDFVNDYFDEDFVQYGYSKVYKIEDLP